MNYIPRKKILVEKYSMEIEAEEFLNDILELCYTISFVHNIQARIINGHPTKDKQCELTYLIVKLPSILRFMMFNPFNQLSDEIITFGNIVN